MPLAAGDRVGPYEVIGSLPPRIHIVTNWFEELKGRVR
jgi:hypothetical protein